MATVEAPETPAPAVTFDELVRLFRGDQDSMGYAHPCLVTAMCERWPGQYEAPSPLLIVKRVYGPDVTADDVNEIPRQAIGEGYDDWIRAGKKRVPR